MFPSRHIFFYINQDSISWYNSLATYPKHESNPSMCLSISYVWIKCKVSSCTHQFSLCTQQLKWNYKNVLHIIFFSSPFTLPRHIFCITETLSCWYRKSNPVIIKKIITINAIRLEQKTEFGSYRILFLVLTGLHFW